jgi:hypothetical protein
LSFGQADISFRKTEFMLVKKFTLRDHPAAMNAPNSCTGTPPTAGWNARGAMLCAPAEVGATASEMRLKRGARTKKFGNRSLWFAVLATR